MTSRPPATLPLLPASSHHPARPPTSLGELYVRPAAAPFLPISKWPRAQRLAELARVDAALATLAEPRAGDPAGNLAPVGTSGRDVAKKSLEKYRRRLVRALGPNPRRRR